MNEQNERWCLRNDQQWFVDHWYRSDLSTRGRFWVIDPDLQAVLSSDPADAIAALQHAWKGRNEMWVIGRQVHEITPTNLYFVYEWRAPGDD